MASKLLELNAQLEKARQEVMRIRKMMEKYMIEYRNTYHFVYKICVKPSKSEYLQSVQSVIGYCSTKELAEKLIKNGTFYDSEDDCYWNYSIETCDIKNLSDYNISKIDQIPSTPFL